MAEPGKSMETGTDRCEKVHPDAGGISRSAGLDIRQLVAEHYQAVYRYAFRLTGSPADAEDVTQQTFLIAHRKLHQVREPEKANHWLFAVLRSCYLKSRRRQRPIPAANLELNVDEVPDHNSAENFIDREVLQSALDELDDEFKFVLMMFYFEDLSYKEIAAKLQIPIGTVMSRLSRGKGHLRRRLLSEISDGPDPDRSDGEGTCTSLSFSTAVGTDGRPSRSLW